MKKFIFLFLIFQPFLLVYTEGWQKFYVFSSTDPSRNRYIPSGYMGDTMDLSISAAKIRSPSGSDHCLRIRYTPDGINQWAGVYWQNPANNWGAVKGGYNLTGVQKLTFWIKGKEGSEKIAGIKIGGITGKYSDTDSFSTTSIVLSKNWKKYEIPLTGLDLSYISGGFCIILKKEDNPSGCEFYLDEICYEGPNIPALDKEKDTTPPSVSLVCSIKDFYPSEENRLIFKTYAFDETGIDRWTLQIFAPNRLSIKNFSGQGTPPNEVVWDGKDRHGNFISPGKYNALLTATDMSGLQGISDTVEFQVVEEKNAEKFPRIKEYIFFSPNSAEITEFVKNKLDKIARKFLDGNYLTLKVYGYTDNTGSSEENVRLSLKRAKIIANYLIDRWKIKKEAVDVAGFGSANPIATNKTKKGREKNRRVEVILE